MQYLVILYRVTADNTGTYYTKYGEGIEWCWDPKGETWVKDENGDIIFLTTGDRVDSIQIVNDSELPGWLFLNQTFAGNLLFTSNEIRQALGAPRLDEEEDVVPGIG